MYVWGWGEGGREVGVVVQVAAGGGGEYEYKSRNVFIHTTHIVTTSSTEPILSQENIPNGIQNRGHCSFNHQATKER